MGRAQSKSSFSSTSASRTVRTSQEGVSLISVAGFKFPWMLMDFESFLLDVAVSTLIIT